MADSTPKSYSTDPTLYLYTSLTAGSSHIITATSRLETILKSHRIPFQGLDVATDEKARMLWGRRAGKRKLPGLVRMGLVIGDLDEIEEWNEYGELKEHIDVPQAAAITPGTSANVTPMNTPSKAPTVQAVHEKTKLSTQSSSEPVPKPSLTPLTDAMRRLGEEAAKKAGEKKPNSLMRASQAKDAEKAPMETRTIPNDGAVVPAPSGTIEQTSATPGNSLAQAAAEDEESEAPAPQPSSLSDSGTSPAELDVSLAKDAPVSRYGGSNVSTASPDVIKDLEERLAIAEESEEDSEAGAGHPEDASEEERSKLSLSKAQQRTQDQPAADENLAAASVDD